MHDSGVRVLMPDRPGYGGSTRRPGRSVADVAHDVRTLADARGCDHFAVYGGPWRVVRSSITGNRRLHVAFEAHLQHSYLDNCGFRRPQAGLLHLR